MSVLAQGTHIFFIHPNYDSGGPAVVRLQCATAFNAGGAPRDQLDDTCLEDMDARSKAGLRRPGVATIGINPDPQYESHKLLYDLFNGGEQVDIKFAVGWADGTAAPTLGSDGDFSLPTSRTWFLYEAYVSDFPFDHALNTIVAGTISLQRSGGSNWIPKVIAPAS